MEHRPVKRMRLTPSPDQPQFQYAQLSSQAAQPWTEFEASLRPLSTPDLLLALPSLLLQPPEHPYHTRSIDLSLRALRRCLQLPALPPETECRAWTALAEIGMRAVQNQQYHPDQAYAAPTEALKQEVDKAISKGMLISQKHPILRIFRHHLTLLHAQWSALTAQTDKFAKSLLKKMLTPGYFTPNDPPHIIYSTYLTYIHRHLSPSRSNTVIPLEGPTAPLQDLKTALIALQNLQDLAKGNSHNNVVLLCHVIRLRILIAARMWSEVRNAVVAVEGALGLSYEAPPPQQQATSSSSSSFSSGPSSSQVPYPPTPQAPAHTPTAAPNPAVKRRPDEVPNPATFVQFLDPFEHTMALHALALSITWFAYLGWATEVSMRLAHLHSLMDAGLPKNPEHVQIGIEEGILELSLGDTHHPLRIHTTHPQTLLLTVYTLSAAVKRDAVGRRPKRVVFASEGLRVTNINQAQGAAGISVPPWANAAHMAELKRTTDAIKADLLSEQIGVSILRSEFNVAETTLANLITHTTSASTHPAYSTSDPTSLFRTYAPLITLYHAFLAHSLGKYERALDCYRVAAYLDAQQASRDARPHDSTPGSGSESDYGNSLGFVGASAKIGEVALQLGLLQMKENDLAAYEQQQQQQQQDVMGSGGYNEMRMILERERAEVLKFGRATVDMCKGMGGTIMAIGEVVEACMSREIVKAKSHLKVALNCASKSLDNHLRALVMALVSACYVHTAADHAQAMLLTCEQLAAGLGAPPDRPSQQQQQQQQPPPIAADLRVGNAQLRLWCGEQFLDLFQRAGKSVKAEKQQRTNDKMRAILQEMRNPTTSHVTSTAPNAAGSSSSVSG